MEQSDSPSTTAVEGTTTATNVATNDSIDGSAGAQLLFNLANDHIAISDNEVAACESNTAAQILNIKQEITSEAMELPAEAVPMVLHEGEPIALEDFLNQQDIQLKDLKTDVDYLTKCFEVMYKFKSIFDLVVDDYFKSDPHFKYKNVLEDLENDLIAVISEDEEKYQALLGEINTDVVLTEEDQMEFAERSHLSDDEASDLSSIEVGRSKLVQIVNGVEVTTHMRKLPGQKTAEQPECPACGFKARCRLKLEAHVLEHVDDPLVVCNHECCDITFNIHRMFQHEKDYHPEVNLTCEMCNEMFESKTMLIQHYKQHIKRKEKLKCHLCDYTDIYVGRMDRHKQSEHGLTITKQFKCDYEGCGRVFKDRPSFYTHSLIHKDRSLVYKHKCSVEGCDAVFKRRRNMHLHMQKHGSSNRKRFTCHVQNCKRTYSRERELSRHIELCHQSDSAGVKTFQYVDETPSVKKEFDTERNCVALPDINKEGNESTINTNNAEFEESNAAAKTSGETSTNEENIIYVKSLNDQNVTTVNVISCDEMEVEDGGTSNQITEHMIEVDENGNSTNGKLIVLVNKGAEGEQHLELVSSNGTMMNEVLCDGDSTLTDECELCSIKFPSSQEMISHLKERHHQYTIRAYRCDFAGCTFATHFRSILGKHKNNTHGGKYKCEVCGKLSKDSGNHNRHRNIHKNVVFRCRYENCEAVYKSPKAYYVHVLTHSNEQPVYRCDFPQCKYVTYYMNTLNVHKLTHSDVRNFFCPYENCGKGFKRNGDLNKHITHSHKGVKRPQKKRKTMTDTTQVMYRCTWPSCSYIASDHETLTKHEEEHAGNSLQKYKFEVSVDDE